MLLSHIAPLLGKFRIHEDFIFIENYKFFMIMDDILNDYKPSSHNVEIKS